MDQNLFVDNPVLGSKLLDPNYLFNQGVLFFRKLAEMANNSDDLIVSTYQIVSILLFFMTLFFIVMIAYCVIRLHEIRKKEHAHLKHEIAEYAHHHAEKEKKKQEGDAISKNPRWIKTLNLLFSQHSSDWKLSVMEADSMLEDLMNQLGFKGDTLGDKLKTAGQGNFRHLSSAWEVHSARNRIAHEGVNFELSQHEAKRVIALYEQIFREFGYI